MKQSLSTEIIVKYLFSRPKINYWKKVELVNEASVDILVLRLVVETITLYLVQVAKRVVLPLLGSL